MPKNLPGITLNYVSPSYTHEKLDSPSYGDLVDVFEDRMRKWILKPARHLLTLEDGEVPAVSLVLSYFEGIEIYISGKNSKNASKDFFRRGFKRVFCVTSVNATLFDEIVDELYVQARCGFAHDGLFRNRVFFSNARPEAINVTWPKRNGEFIKDGRLESVVINAASFIDGIEKHFNQYREVLRSEVDFTLKENFLAAIDLKWGLNELNRVIGMSEEDFFGVV